jgi:hypothetical protein
MDITALSVITSAYKRCNRLSPGETLSADDAVAAFDVLNEFVDELSAQPAFCFLSTLTSAPQSGNITLGSGAWAAVAPGDDIASATADNLAMSLITMQQFNELYQPTVTGRPTIWAQDGLGTVYLWPVPTGHTIKLMTRNPVAQFADLTTSYTVPDGWKAALSAGLAVRIAPVITGRVTPELERRARDALSAVCHYEPAIYGVETFTKSRQYFPPRLF